MTNAKPRTLSDALKKIAVLKREITAARNRLVEERDGVKAEIVLWVNQYYAMWIKRDLAILERDEALDALDAVKAKIVETDAPTP